MKPDETAQVALSQITAGGGVALFIVAVALVAVRTFS